MSFNIGRYEVLEKLGSGGMAHVYLAHDPYVKRQVAIKVMSAAVTADPEFRERFQKEAEVVAKLDHPFIVPIYDFGYFDNQPYLVIRYMVGGSVKERLEDTGPMAFSNAAKIIERMAAALDEAHRHNIVHRDVKPENILMDQKGETFLADFGIVKILSGGGTTTSAGWITGTPAYMSPEQVHGEIEVDRRADIYSLAIVLFELLSGKRPYYDDNQTKLMIKHVLDPVPRITKLLPDAPAGLEEVLMKALAKKPEERYDTAGQFSEAVNGVGRAILSRRARKRWMADELADALDSLGDEE